jgi:multicomponent Na+:H+ antiporter subunit F
MSGFLAGAAVFLLFNIALGLIRVWRGPTAADRMLAAQLFGTTGIAIVLLLAVAGGEPAGVDVALVFALLAVLTLLAFVRRLLLSREGRD